MLREPVTHQVGEWSVTIDRVVVDRNETQVACTIYGPFKWKGERFKQPDLNYQGFIQVRDESGASVSSEGPRMFPMSHSFGAMGSSVSCTANMGPLTTMPERFEIFIGEPLPPTVIPVTLSAFADSAMPARQLDVSDEHHGVVITAHAIGRGESMTAALLHASLRPHARQRFMRALGTLRDSPREPPGVAIQDESGKEITAFAATRELSAGPDLRTIAVFPGLPAGSRSVALVVPYVVLSEYTGSPVKLTVPFAGEITIGDDTAFVKVGRVTTERAGAAVSVELTGSWRDDRRLLYAESLTVGDTYSGVGFRGMPGEPPIETFAGDPSGDATSVSLESPVIQLRGPWRMHAMLP